MRPPPPPPASGPPASGPAPQPELSLPLATLGTRPAAPAAARASRGGRARRYRCIDDHVASATKALGLLYGANLARPRVSYKDFYNDAINELVDFSEDFARWKDTQRCSFSFCAHSFVLDPATKSKLLQLDANNQMRSQIRGALFRSIFGGSECPYLILRVRREHLIRDTLLQISALQHQHEDLKKPLKVIFKGEEGIDEGGVQKEFFQLIIRQTFDLNYGMFTHEEETNCFWFSSTALENAREFNLIGKVLPARPPILSLHLADRCRQTYASHRFSGSPSTTLSSSTCTFRWWCTASSWASRRRSTTSRGSSRRSGAGCSSCSTSTATWRRCAASWRRLPAPVLAGDALFSCDCCQLMCMLSLNHFASSRRCTRVPSLSTMRNSA